MTVFQSLRVVHEFTQTNPAPPTRVFPLLCPVREAEWVPDWEYRLIYSDSGVAELGCIFTTPNAPTPNPAPHPPSSDKPTYDSAAPRAVASESTWITTEYDPAVFRVAYVWINPKLVAAEIRIQLAPTADGHTKAQIRYRYTGLSPEGNREVARYDRQWFETKMHGWEAAINHYLQTGRKIASASWE